MIRSFSIVGVAVALTGCAALRDDMKRAEDSYDQARYEDSLVWLEELEDSTPDMEVDMRARFYYLRGMTAYRLGHRDDALHYLALAREVAGEETSRALRPEQRQTMTRTLDELTPHDASFRARASTTVTTTEEPSDPDATLPAAPPTLD